MNVEKLCEYLGMPYTAKGSYAGELHGPAPIDLAEEGTYTFCDHPGVSKPTRRPLDILDDPPIAMTEEEENQAMERILNSKASAIITPKFLVRVDPIPDKELIFVDNPRLAFMNVVNSMEKVQKPYISQYSILHDNVRIGENVSIGSGTVVGASGFGFWRMSSGELRKFPQIGGVVIEDNVEIQANTCIDCGALGDTIIRRGAKIDNFVHIAHNVDVGENVAIVAHAMIGGGVKIGKNSWIGPSASILNAVNIGEGCVVGMGSVVIKDVPDGATVKGVPAK